MNTEQLTEVIEGNKLIAEFMGGIRKEPKNADPYYQFFDHEGLILRQTPEAKLKYHTSWDWLMPVVEKMQEVEVNNNRVVRTSAEVTIYYKACRIEYSPDEEGGDENGEFAVYTSGESKIEAVWKACVEFIKWYNQTNSK